MACYHELMPNLSRGITMSLLSQWVRSIQWLVCSILCLTSTQFVWAPDGTMPATYEQLVRNSQTFHKFIPFPTKANRIATIAGSDKKKQDIITHQANTTRPLVDVKVLK